MSADVCVIGLGVVGLPLAVSLARAGLRCVGVDTDQAHLDAIGHAAPFPHEPGLDDALAEVLAAGLLTLDAHAVSSRAYVIAVSPGAPEDLSLLVEGLLAYAPGALIVVESTCAPGWVRRGVADVLERAGLEPGRGVFVAHAPERVTPGRAMRDLREVARVIGGATPACAERARELYALICSGPLHLTDLETAALSKLAENAYRAVNIALADELSDLAAAHGADITRALELANGHPRVHLHRPGLGAWGRCLPLALELLSGEDAPVMSAARDATVARPGRAAARVARALEGVDAPRVALLGVTYKPDVPDTRAAPAEVMLRWWREHAPHIEVLAHDPCARAWPHGDLLPLEDAVSGAHALVVATAHSAFGSWTAAELAGAHASCWLFDFHGVLRQQVSSHPDFVYVGPGVDGVRPH